MYLGIRFFCAGLLFLAIALVQRRHFPKRKELPKHIIAGMLMNGFYLGFAYVAIAKGLPAGIMALIGALQPALVTLLAFLIIKEKTSLKGIVGMLIGMVGLMLVVSPALGLDMNHGGVSLFTFALACSAIFALSLGVTYQKMSISSSDIFSSMAIQNLAASVVSFGFVLILGESLFRVQLESVLLMFLGRDCIVRRRRLFNGVVAEKSQSLASLNRLITSATFGGDRKLFLIHGVHDDDSDRRLCGDYHWGVFESN